jgi:hypothetical protein
MWAMAVVVPGVAAKHTFEMAGVHDEDVVEALESDGSDESLGVGVGVRRPKRGSQDLGALGPEDLVEAGNVLRVTIAK